MQTEREAKLKPCPFCRKRPSGEERFDFVELSGSELGTELDLSDLYAVRCTNASCGVSGPYKSSELEATIAWNTRCRRLDE